MTLVVTARESVADESRAARPWDRLGANVAGAFSGWNALYQVAGVGATAAMATQGVDREAYRFFAKHEGLGYAGTPGLLLGYAAPIAVIGAFYVAGSRNDDNQAIGAGAAVLQSLVLCLAHTTILKLATGRRAPPDPADDSPGRLRDPADTFRFGFARGGLYDGWPSGHTATAVAIGVTLASYYDAWWIDAVGYATVAYMMFSVTAFEGGIHWASDAVAAVLMTYPIARSVGHGFRAQLADRSPVAFTFSPSVIGGAPALVLGGSF